MLARVIRTHPFRRSDLAAKTSAAATQSTKCGEQSTKGLNVQSLADCVEPRGRCINKKAIQKLVHCLFY